MNFLIHIFLLVLVTNINANVNRPGPEVIATRGGVWPKPKLQTRYETYLVLNPNEFRFRAIQNDCDFLQNAFSRYIQMLRLTINNYATLSPRAWENDPFFKGYLQELQVKLSKPCEEVPYLNMDESYELKVNSTESVRALLSANTIWGALRGLETFSQVVIKDDDLAIDLILNNGRIQDAPRFSYRGLMLDTSRHFIPVTQILQILDGMAFNKLNVFHWHIVDDQSFPFQSLALPLLSKGAYHPTLIYSLTDVVNIVEYARLRGIRVIPEFDTPGHVRSWGVGYPELLTPCYEKGKPNGIIGHINPVKETTYDSLKELFKEIHQLFPDKYVHLGGDEVDFQCWEDNPEVEGFMGKKGMEDYEQLEEYYFLRIVKMLAAVNSSSMAWQEVFENGINLPSNTIIQVWTEDQEDQLRQITSAGRLAILSSCWYLHVLDTGGDWEKFYECEPLDFNGTDKQKQRVVGGEACLWSEVIDGTNVVQRIFPRASATAERLWSPRDVINQQEAAARLEEHTCRMNKRGVPAQPPNGPGFCI